MRPSWPGPRAMSSRCVSRLASTFVQLLARALLSPYDKLYASPNGMVKMMPGRVYLVGAGPGDPGLITLKGLECLARADLVLYDGLVNPLILQLTHGQAERTCRSESPAGRHLD